MSKDKSTLKLVEPHVDAETRVHDDHHLSVRLWLRMLSCTNRIENFVRQNLQANFDTTLPRFDLDRKSTRLNSSHSTLSRMPSSA